MNYDLSLARVRRAKRPMETNFPLFVGGRQFQYIHLVLRNNAGTIQHAFTANGSVTGTPWPLVTNKFRNIAPLSAYTNTPTVGAGTGFSAGLGIVTQWIVFDTEPFDLLSPRIMDHGELTYYNGNNTRIRLRPGITPINVLGSTVPRFVFGLYSYPAGAAVNVSTTWLPNGTQAQFQWMGYL